MCEGTIITLNAGNPGETYLWSTGETTQTIKVSTSGKYSVTVTNKNNCSISSSVNITFHNPFIKEVKINNYTAEIIAVGNPPLQYSLDKIHWQYSSVFYNLKFEVYNAYVKNAMECISNPFPFAILNLPNVITPNKDGMNDVWNLKGLELYPGSSVKIFDRYGKLIVNTKIDKEGFVWDGTYLGRNVPSASYWYVIDLTDGRKLTGWIVVRNYNEKDQ